MICYILTNLYFFDAYNLQIISLMKLSSIFLLSCVFNKSMHNDKWKRIVDSFVTIYNKAFPLYHFKIKRPHTCRPWEHTQNSMEDNFYLVGQFMKWSCCYFTINIKYWKIRNLLFYIFWNLKLQTCCLVWNLQWYVWWSCSLFLLLWALEKNMYKSRW